MRSLDPVNTATAHHPAPRAAMASRARNGKAAPIFRFSSTVKAAAAAAAAAAATTAAKRSAAAAAAASAAATAHAAGAVNGATEQVQPAAEEPRERPVNLKVTPNAPAAGVTAAAVAVKRVADNARTLGVPPVPAREEEAAADSAVEEGDHARGSFERVCDSEAINDPTTKADQDLEQVVSNPFMSSQKLARTPPTASAPSAVVAISGAAVAQVSKDTETFCSSPLAATRAAAPRTGDDRARQESPEPMVAVDPFASKSRVPRTPVEEAAASQLSRGAAVAGAGGESAGVGVGEVDEPAARVPIGELRQEVASLADRLAKQADERNR